MKPYLDNHITQYCMDFRENDLPDESVQMVCTSPPYWGLRKYSGEQDLIWGDNLICRQCSGIIRSGGDNGLHYMQTGNNKGIKKGQSQHLQQGVLNRVSKEGEQVEQTAEGVKDGSGESVLERWNKENTRIQDDISKRPSELSEGLCNGASPSNGETNRAVFKEGRGSPSYKRNQRRQPARKPTNCSKESPQRPSNMSTLPEDICDKLVCPNCGSQDLYHCEHEWGSLLSITKGGKGQQKGLKGNIHITETWDNSQTLEQGNFCSLCGAWKGGYGLEPTPELYIEHTIEILREIRRVLRKDGVVFWNIGDSYASTPGLSRQGSTLVGTTISQDASKGLPKRDFSGIKPKDLCLIPFRVAIAAQEDGWWVRSVIIWSKPNPMPESVTDRPTESHEYILMLTKSAKYYYDMEAVREEYSPSTNSEGYRFGGNKYNRNDSPLHGQQGIFNKANGRNIRSVWEFPTQPFPEAHFAVFPEKLPEICIKAATPEVGCCSNCGAPWERITQVIGKERVSWGVDKKARILGTPGEPAYKNITETIGWQPTCKCNADKVPSVVLDCFSGAGTSLWVAKKLNRRAIGFDISEEYCELAIKRNRQQVMV